MAWPALIGAATSMFGGGGGGNGGVLKQAGNTLGNLNRSDPATSETSTTTGDFTFGGIAFGPVTEVREDTRSRSAFAADEDTGGLSTPIILGGAVLGAGLLIFLALRK